MDAHRRPDRAKHVPDTHLAAAVVSTQVTIPAWSSERRFAPLADRETFIRLLRAVLAAADGSLTAADMAQALATRLDHRRTPLSIELDVLESIAERRHVKILPLRRPPASALPRSSINWTTGADPHRTVRAACP